MVPEIKSDWKNLKERERSGSVVECVSHDPRVAGSSLTSVTGMCPCKTH